MVDERFKARLRLTLDQLEDDIAVGFAWTAEGAQLVEDVLPRSDFQRRRLPFDLRQIGVEARPFRRGVGPDGRRGGGQIGIVERSRPDEDNSRPLFRLAEHIRPASGAKTPVHSRAAIGLAHVVGERTRNGDVLRAEEDADRPVSGAEILANAAPAISSAERRLGVDFVADSAAQTSAPNRQEKPPINRAKSRYEESATSTSLVPK